MRNINISIKLSEFFNFTLLTFMVLIGPNIEIINIEIYNIYYIIIASFFYLNNLLFKKKRYSSPLFIYYPSIVAILSLLFKILYSENIMMRNLIDTVRYVLLFMLFDNIIYLFQDLELVELRKKISKFRNILLFSALFVSILALLQFLLPNSFQNIFSFLYEKELDNSEIVHSNFQLASALSRVGSIYNTPLKLAEMLSYLFVIIFFFSIPKNKIFGYFTSFLALTAIILSNSRASLLALVIVIFLYYYLYREKDLIFFSGMLILIVSLFTTILPLFTDENLGRVNELTYLFKSGELPSTIQARLEDMEKIWYSINSTHYIITGVSADFYEKFLYGISYQSQHFRWFGNYGILGFTLSFWLIYILIKYYKFYKNENDLFLKNQFYIIFSLLLVNFIISFSQSSSLSPRSREVFFIFLAIIWLYMKKLRST